MFTVDFYFRLGRQSEKTARKNGRFYAFIPIADNIYFLFASFKGYARSVGKHNLQIVFRMPDIGVYASALSNCLQLPSALRNSDSKATSWRLYPGVVTLELLLDSATWRIQDASAALSRTLM